MRKSLFVFFLLFLAAPSFGYGPQDVPRITVQELKARLDSGEEMVIVDVRSAGSYNSSRVKIKGAIRISPDEIAKRAGEIPMGKELILY